MYFYIHCIIGTTRENPPASLNLSECLFYNGANLTKFDISSYHFFLLIAMHIFYLSHCEGFDNPFYTINILSHHILVYDEHRKRDHLGVGFKQRTESVLPDFDDCVGIRCSFSYCDFSRLLSSAYFIDFSVYRPFSKFRTSHCLPP